MKSQSLIQNRLLPLNSVKLGRLVLNVKSPHQDFLDPVNGQLQPESIVKPQENFEDILNLSKTSKIRSRITALLAISYENRNTSAVKLTATRATTYQLLNSGTWFKNACAIPETRKWLEYAIEMDGNVYLVVGFHTLTDTRVTETVTSGGTTNGGATFTGRSLGGVVPAPVGDLLSSRVDSTRGVEHSRSRSFDAPGEQIYAVQYRKVEFKWFSSRKIERISLERDNRWKVYWSEQVRGDNSPEADWEDGGSDGDEDEDVLEADLIDDIDFESSEKYVSEGGEEEFIF